MAFRYENVVPWGRSYEEYLRMFDLRPDDLKRCILGCADGPASFNSELTRRGGGVVSVDPLYGRAGYSYWLKSTSRLRPRSWNHSVSSTGGATSSSSGFRSIVMASVGQALTQSAQPMQFSRITS